MKPETKIALVRELGKIKDFPDKESE